MFTGEYHHNLDAKGRLIIPVRFREGLGTEFTVTRALDGCLAMYASTEWQALEAKLTALPMTNEKARSLKRFLLGSATTCELDKQGRILIPQVLREKASSTRTSHFLVSVITSRSGIQISTTKSITSTTKRLWKPTGRD